MINNNRFGDLKWQKQKQRERESYSASLTADQITELQNKISEGKQAEQILNTYLKKVNIKKQKIALLSKEEFYNYISQNPITKLGYTWNNEIYPLQIQGSLNSGDFNRPSNLTQFNKNNIARCIVNRDLSIFDDNQAHFNNSGNNTEISYYYAGNWSYIYGLNDKSQGIIYGIYSFGSRLVNQTSLRPVMRYED